METLQTPFTAIVTILIGAGVLAIAFVDAGLWGEEALAPAAGRASSSFATQSELLVRRYLKNEDYTFASLLSDMRGYFGGRAEEVILKETAHILLAGPGGRAGRLYSLRGLALRSMGKNEKARESFRKALRLNPGDRAARAALAKSDVDMVVKEMGKAEMEKVFGLEEDTEAERRAAAQGGA